MKRLNLKDMVDLKAGHPFRGRIENMPWESVRVVRMKDAKPDRGIHWESLIRTKLPGKRKPTFLAKGSILFLARGKRNFAVCLGDVPVRAVCSPHFFLLIVRNGDELAPEFLAWQINQASAQAYLKKSAEGSNSRSIRRGILEEAPIVAPDMDVQQKIIALNRTFLEEQAVMKRLMENRRKMMAAVARSVLGGV